MNTIYNSVIMYKGKVGKLIETRKGGNALAGNGKVIYKFYPAGYGSYYKDALETVKNPEEEVVIAGSADGKEYAIKEFRLHRRDVDYIKINDKYQIIVDDEGKYHPHIDYKCISRMFNDLKSALLGLIIYDSVGTEDIHLNKYIFKLLDMEW